MQGQPSDRLLENKALSSIDRLSVTVRLYIASNVRLYREGLLASLSRQPALDVVGTGSLSVALTQIAELMPDVLLLDLIAKESLSLPRRARLIIPTLRVVAFAVAETESNIVACAEAGICGYAPQDASADDLANVVTLAMRDELACSPQIAGLLYRLVANSTPPGHVSETTLTRREGEIAALLRDGLSNKDIARRLRLGNSTVKNHVHNILQKLDIQRRGQIAPMLHAAASLAN